MCKRLFLNAGRGVLETAASVAPYVIPDFHTPSYFFFFSRFFRVSVEPYFLCRFLSWARSLPLMFRLLKRRRLRDFVVVVVVVIVCGTIDTTSVYV